MTAVRHSFFPFNQPEGTSETPSRDCGWRCLFYALGITDTGYDEWLRQYALFQPTKAGITFQDICHALDHASLDHRFTQLSDSGLFIVYSGVWMKQYGKNHGHYFVYHDGVVLCSTRPGPEPRPLADVVKRLEAKTAEGAFRCLKVY